MFPARVDFDGVSARIDLIFLVKKGDIKTMNATAFVHDKMLITCEFCDEMPGKVDVYFEGVTKIYCPDCFDLEWWSGIIPIENASLD